jgi:endonuclease/exonuclease/phosphatase family metal-dependent hydrolase
MRMVFALAVAVLATGVPARAADVPDIKVMSYNIRYGTAKDGENHWDKRKGFLADTVKAFDPDLFGTQETLAAQRDFLAEQLPKYGVFGVGRDDGKDKGEMMAVYWRKERFEKLDGGHFWLSETPDTAGSKSWDSSLPRMATWVKLRDHKAKDAKPVLWINTHFDHMGKQSRLEAAKIIRERLLALGKDCSVLVTGDFNADEGSEPYKALFDKQGEKESPVVDSLRVAHPKKLDDEGTTSDFKADAKGGPRIDWIGCSRDWKVQKAGIDRTAKDGRTPSDHFAVFAVLGR